MKALNTVLKILAALAALAGAVYVVATYGDKIVAWAKKLWASLPQCPAADVAEEADFAPEEEAPQATEEAPQEEPEVQEPAPQIPENDPIADETDFADQ